MPSKTTLILVHGMGTPTDAMFDRWRGTLKTLYERYSNGERFEDRFDCVPVEYDSVFQARRGQWTELVDSMRQSGVLHGLPTQEELESITGDNFFTTHVLDVLLYRFVEPIAENVRAHMVARLTEVMRNADDVSKVAVIAHSLGTAVVHDSVNAFYATISPRTFRFRLLGMIANVSRTLETRWDVYDPKVRPGIDGSDSYAADYFLTASHAWDPFVALRRFDPHDAWPDADTRRANRASILRPTLLHGWNMHAFEHYLEDPMVHVPLFRALRYQTFVTQAEEEAALFAYRNTTPPARIREYRDEVKKLMTGEADFSWARLVAVYKQTYELMENYTPGASQP